MLSLVVVAIVVVVTAAHPGHVHPSTTPDGHVHGGGPYPVNFPTPTEAYFTFAQLDPKGNYFLFWKSNDTDILFEAHVKTKGYVGFGISHNGGMSHADVVIGWVSSDGKSHFADRHAVGHYEPMIDQSQDWTLLASAENDFGTMLKFSRPIDTCDDQDDIVIEHGTTKVIYTYSNEDPVHETGLSYHGASRGSKSLLLLDKFPTLKTLPSDSKHFDFINKQFRVPPVRTYYHCTIYELPKMSTKNHIVMFEPVVQTGNEDIVHHVVIYVCAGNLHEHVGKEYECYSDPTTTREMNECASVFLAWAVGGGPAFLPDNAGIPLGESGGPTHYILETHYNNPNLHVGRVDSSGIRIHYTPTLRQHDAGTLETGAIVDQMQVVPPGFQHFQSRGYCSEHCLKKSLTRMPNQEIRIFAAFQHSHLLGRAIRTRLVRNGTELSPIATDGFYDFDYQETRILAEERVVKVGDQIITECDYDSRGKRSITYGGLGTDDEMCITFLMYYPRMPMSNCLSNPAYDMYISGVKEYHAFRGFLSAIDWKNATIRDDFQHQTDVSVYKYQCHDYSGSDELRYAQKDPIVKSFIPPSRSCN